MATLDFKGYEKEREEEQKCIRALHSDISDVARGAVTGCQICDIIWRHFFRDKTAREYMENPGFLRGNSIHTYSRSGTHYRFRKPENLSRHASDYGPDAVTIEVGLNSPMDKDIPEWKDITMIPVEDEPAIDMNSLPKPDLSIYGPHTWSIIENWMSNCKRNHRRCNETSKGTQWYPTRLLNLDYHESSDPVERLVALLRFFADGHLPADCKLIETTDTPITGPYMTLSHRWNSDGKSCITNKSNITQRKESIKAEELPEIFEDAIHFARRVGVRYLWIDSLCIIQDDPDDWKREAQIMDRVYAHSLLSLEGTVGNSSLLQPRYPPTIAPCILQSHWEGLRSVKYVVTDFRYWDARIFRSVCNTRAWITQERWLAPRILHFTFDQLLWECHELEAGETFPHGLTKEAQSQSSVGFKKWPEASTDKSPRSENDTLMYHWRKLLLTYGRTEVTEESDRLVAIAGIAKRFSTILNDEWVAGLWRKHLPGDLLWSVEEARRSNKPPTETTTSFVASRGLGIHRSHQIHKSERLTGARYQAPSWSWGSVLGDINPGFETKDGSEDSMIDILGVELTPADTEMPLGRLASGTLRLRGTLYPMAIDPPDWTPQAAKRNPVGLPPTVYITGLSKTREPSIPGLAWPDAITSNSKYAHFLDAHSHIAHLKPDEPVDYLDLARSCYLPIRKHVYDNPKSQYHGTHLIAGLALMPTGKRGEYTRLGRMDFSYAKAKLFEDGVEVQRKGEEATGLKAHPPTMDPVLYVDGELRVFTVV
ncbi:Nn.00g043650.m01.CDS01 [Neocucurbitaria sp. VM-36]